MRLLHGLREAPDRIEVDELAVILGALVLPDRLHGLDPLAQEPPARLEVRAVVRHLLDVPPGADAENGATVGEGVEARDLFGEHDRIALDDEVDTGGEPELLRRSGRERERDERVVRAIVLAWQIAARGVRRLARGRDVRVLGEEQRLEATLLGRTGNLVGADRI